MLVQLYPCTIMNVEGYIVSTLTSLIKRILRLIIKLEFFIDTYRYQLNRLIRTQPLA
jgi:hypothetical protein